MFTRLKLAAPVAAHRPPACLRQRRPAAPDSGLSLPSVPSSSAGSALRPRRRRARCAKGGAHVGDSRSKQLHAPHSTASRAPAWVWSAAGGIVLDSGCARTFEWMGIDWQEVVGVAGRELGADPAVACGATYSNEFEFGLNGKRSWFRRASSTPATSKTCCAPTSRPRVPSLISTSCRYPIGPWPPTWSAARWWSSSTATWPPRCAPAWQFQAPSLR